MGIKVSYEPVGALGRLAHQAGVATGTARRAERHEEYGFRRGMLERQLDATAEQNRIDRRFRVHTLGMQIRSQRVAEDATARRQRAGEAAVARRQRELYTELMPEADRQRWEMDNPDPESDQGRRLTDIAEQRLRMTTNVKAEMGNEQAEAQHRKRLGQIDKAEADGMVNAETADRMRQDAEMKMMDLKTPIMPEGTIQDQWEENTAVVGTKVIHRDPQSGETTVIGDSDEEKRRQEDILRADKERKEENAQIDKLKADLIKQEEERRANLPVPEEGEEVEELPPIDHNQYWETARKLIQARQELIAEEEAEAGAEEEEPATYEDMAQGHPARQPFPYQQGPVFGSPDRGDPTSGWSNTPSAPPDAPLPPPSPETLDAAIDDLRLRLGRWPTKEEVAEYLNANPS